MVSIGGLAVDIVPPSGEEAVIAKINLLKDSNAVAPTGEDAMAAAIPAVDAALIFAKQSTDDGVKQALKARIGGLVRQSGGDSRIGRPCKQQKLSPESQKQPYQQQYDRQVQLQQLQQRRSTNNNDRSMGTFSNGSERSR